MNHLDRFLSVFNAIIPIIVIVFLLMTHGNYVSKEEYKTINEQIFKRLDNVETLIYKLLDDPTHSKNK
jgi:hypothetical protein